MRPRLASTAPLLLLAVALSACDSNKKAKGPNPYRRDLRSADGRVATETAGTTRPAEPPSPSPSVYAVSRPVGRTIAPPVLFVNKDALTVQDVMRPQLRARLEKKAALLAPAEYRAELERTLQYELQTEIGLLLIYQEARKAITDKEDEFFTKQADEEIQHLVNLEFGGRHARFEAHLREQGMTVAEFREKTKRRFIAMRTLRERFNNLKEQPSRAELLRYYETHPAEFTSEPKARMSLIEIRFVSPGERGVQKPAAREKAEQALAELESGVPFAAVARAYSEGPTRSAGGAWAEISPGSLRPRYQPVVDALFRMQPGERSGIIEGPDAFFIVRCDALAPGRRQTFEEAQDELIERILDQRYAEIQNEYIAKLMRNAILVNEAAFLQALIASAPSPAPPSLGGR